jgi:hypothetical protein
VKRRALALTAAIAVSGTLISACGGAQKGAASPPVSPRASTPTASSTTAAPPSPTSSPSGYASPYLDAFEQFWVAYSKADAAGVPSDSGLADHSTGAALALVQGWVRSDANRGVAHRGSARFRDVRASHVTETSAQVSQCMDFSNWPVVATANGQRVETYPSWSDAAVAQVQLVGDSWRVSELTLRRMPC